MTFSAPQSPASAAGSHVFSVLTNGSESNNRSHSSSLSLDPFCAQSHAFYLICKPKTRTSQGKCFECDLIFGVVFLFKLQLVLSKPDESIELPQLIYVHS